MMRKAPLFCTAMALLLLLCAVQLFSPDREMSLMENRLLMFSNQLLVALDLREMDSDFGLLPFPKLEESQADYYCPVSYWWATFAIVPKVNSRFDLTGDAGFYAACLPKNYLDSIGARLRMTVEMRVRENDDGYQYIQILGNNKDTYDDIDPDGAVNDPSISIYKASTVLSTTRRFPYIRHALN